MIQLLGMVLPILERILPDEKTKEEAKLKALEMAQNGELAQLEAGVKLALGQVEINKIEAQGGNWLAQSWRPITMLTFTGLIVARWFGYAAPDLSESEYLKLWSIVEFSLGAYVTGRSVEKIAPTIANALKK